MVLKVWRFESLSSGHISTGTVIGIKRCARLADDTEVKSLALGFMWPDRPIEDLIVTEAGKNGFS